MNICSKGRVAFYKAFIKRWERVEIQKERQERKRENENKGNSTNIRL